MGTRQKSTALVVVALAGLLLGACGGAGSVTTTTAATVTTTSTTAVAITTTAPPASTTTTIATTTTASGGGVVSLVAGIDGAPNATSGEDGPATEAALNNAEDLAVAPNGDIYIADRQSQRLLKISEGILTVAYRGNFNSGENDFAGVDVGSDGTVFFSTGAGIFSWPQTAQ